MPTLDAAVAATLVGGTTTYGALKPGAMFRFPKDPHRTVHRKLEGGWYRSNYDTRSFRTGPNTAVLECQT